MKAQLSFYFSLIFLALSLPSSTFAATNRLFCSQLTGALYTHSLRLAAPPPRYLLDGQDRQLTIHPPAEQGLDDIHRELGKLQTAHHYTGLEFGGFGLSPSTTRGVTDFVRPSSDRSFVLGGLMNEQFTLALVRALVDSRILRLQTWNKNIRITSDVASVDIDFQRLGGVELGWEILREPLNRLSHRILPTTSEEAIRLLENGSIEIPINLEAVLLPGQFNITRTFGDTLRSRTKLGGGKFNYHMHYHPNLSLFQELMKRQIVHDRRLSYMQLLQPSARDLISFSALDIEWFEIRARGTPTDPSSEGISSVAYSMSEINLVADVFAQALLTDPAMTPALAKALKDAEDLNLNVAALVHYAATRAKMAPTVAQNFVTELQLH